MVYKKESMFVLKIMFGVTDSVFSLFIRFYRHIPTYILPRDKYIRIQIPSASEGAEYQKKISEIHLSLNEVYLHLCK